MFFSERNQENICIEWFNSRLKIIDLKSRSGNISIATYFSSQSRFTRCNCLVTLKCINSGFTYAQCRMLHQQSNDEVLPSIPREHWGISKNWASRKGCQTCSVSKSMPIMLKIDDKREKLRNRKVRKFVSNCTYISVREAIATPHPGLYTDELENYIKTNYNVQHTKCEWKHISDWSVHKYLCKYKTSSNQPTTPAHEWIKLPELRSHTFWQCM